MLIKKIHPDSLVQLATDRFRLDKLSRSLGLFQKMFKKWCKDQNCIQVESMLFSEQSRAAQIDTL